MNKLSILLLLLSLITLSSSCGGGSSGEPGGTIQDGMRNIVVVPKASPPSFWQTVYAGAKEAEQELDGINVIWKAPAGNESNQQIAIVNRYWNLNVDGVILAAQNVEQLASVGTVSQNTGIPLVVMDTQIPNVTPISYISANNELAGQKAAMELAKYTKGKGKVVMIMNNISESACRERETAFEDMIVNQYTGLELAEKQYHNNNAEKAKEIMAEMLKNQDHFVGVYCSSETATSGALFALEEHGYRKDFTVIGHGVSEDALQALESGAMNALIVQDAFQLGYQSVTTLAAHLNNEEVPNRINTEVYIITANNMNKPEIQTVLGKE